MRGLVRLALLAGVLGVAAPVLAGGPTGGEGPPPETHLRGYPMASEPAKHIDGLTTTGMVALVAMVLVTFAGLSLWFRHYARVIGLPADEEALAHASGNALGVSPRETVFNAVSRAGSWVTPGRVAMGAGISTQEAEGYLQDLARDGRVKAGRDKQGRILYRVPS